MTTTLIFSVLAILASLFINVLIISDAVAQTCTNIAGDWNASETGTVTCTVNGETETELVSGTGIVTFFQNGCDISYDVLTELGTLSRTGTVSQVDLHLSGIAGIFPDCLLTQNNITVNGTIDGNIINLSSSFIVTASCDGQSVSCTGTSTAVLSRMGLPSFAVNPGLNDAWYNPDTDGQGFFITVFPDLSAVSLAWFTYDTELPSLDAVANLGDPGHRWITAVGPIDGNQVLMNIELTSGGLFDTSTEIIRTDPPGSDGTILLTFDSCSTGTIEYNIPSINRQGIVPIERVVDDNIALCEVLSNQ